MKTLAILALILPLGSDNFRVREQQFKTLQDNLILYGRAKVFDITTTDHEVNFRLAELRQQYYREDAVWLVDSLGEMPWIDLCEVPDYQRFLDNNWTWNPDAIFIEDKWPRYKIAARHYFEYLLTNGTSWERVSILHQKGMERSFTWSINQPNANNKLLFYFSNLNTAPLNLYEVALRLEEMK